MRPPELNHPSEMWSCDICGTELPEVTSIDQLDGAVGLRLPRYNCSTSMWRGTRSGFDQVLARLQQFAEHAAFDRDAGRLVVGFQYEDVGGSAG